MRIENYGECITDDTNTRNENAETENTMPEIGNFRSYAGCKAAKKQEMLLLARIAEGDQKAFAEIYGRYVDRIWAYVCRILKPSGLSALCDDITLQTFKKLLLKMGEITIDDTLAPWLYTVARNLALDEIRKKNAVLKSFSVIKSLDEGVSDAVGDSSCKSPLEMTILRENLARVRHLIERLPDKLRTIFEDHIFEGLSVEQIAKKYSKPKGTVMWSIFRAREIIKAQF